MDEPNSVPAGKPNSKNVYIVRHQLGGSRFEYRVYPPAIVLTSGDALTFVNASTQACNWDIKLADGTKLAYGTQAGTVEPGERKEVFTVPILRRPGPVETYDYTLETRDGNHVIGFSDPMIIIDPAP